jgi:hypothetical protein
MGGSLWREEKGVLTRLVFVLIGYDDEGESGTILPIFYTGSTRFPVSIFAQCEFLYLGSRIPRIGPWLSAFPS